VTSAAESGRPRRTGASADAIADVERAVRATARSVTTRLRVERKWGNDWFVGRDLVFAIFAFSHHVGIEFWRGTALADPDRLLEGTGKNLRHVKVRSVAVAESAALKRLFRSAIALDRAMEKRTR